MCHISWSIMPGPGGGGWGGSILRFKSLPKPLAFYVSKWYPLPSTENKTLASFFNASKDKQETTDHCGLLVPRRLHAFPYNLLHCDYPVNTATSNHSCPLGALCDFCQNFTTPLAATLSIYSVRCI